MPILKPGQIFGRYQIVAQVGRGGMGEVYRAMQMSIDRPVALKVLLPELAERSPAFAQRFVREAVAAACLNHPHIVTVHDAGHLRVDGRNLSYIAMEFLHGETLRAILKQERRLSAERIQPIAEALAEALAYASGKGLVHRDIKPDNIMFARDGTPKLMDFGVVAWQDGSMVDEQGHEVVGTPAYISPEQARGQPVDGRSDLYSLGCTLFHLFTGRIPFPGPNSREMIRAHLREPVPDPARLVDLPPAWSGIIRRLMAKDPADRFPDARSLLEAIRAVDGPRRPAPAPVATPIRSRPAVRRRPATHHSARLRPAGRPRPVLPPPPAVPAGGRPPAHPASKPSAARPSVPPDPRPHPAPRPLPIPAKTGSFGPKVPQDNESPVLADESAPSQPSDAENDPSAIDQVATDPSPTTLGTGPASTSRPRWRLPPLLPLLVYGFFCLLGCTWRVRVSGHRHLVQAFRSGYPLIGGFLHGRLLPMCWQMSRGGFGRWRVMISRSRDGQFITSLANLLGIQAARGSGGRGGSTAFLELAHGLRQEAGVAAAFTVDGGGRGPRGICKPGIVRLARLTEADLILGGISARPAFVARSWDRFLIPLPFARIHLIISPVIPYDPDRDPEDLRQEIEDRLQALNQEADRSVRRLETDLLKDPASAPQAPERRS